MQVGRKIYYDIATGFVLVDTGEFEGAVANSTIDQDVQKYSELSKRNRNTFEVVELPVGAYSEEFMIAKSYRVNVLTKQIEFNHSPIKEEYQVPLTEQVKQIKQELAVTQEALDFILMGGM